MTLRENIIYYVGVSLCGALITAAFSHFFGKEPDAVSAIDGASDMSMPAPELYKEAPEAIAAASIYKLFLWPIYLAEGFVPKVESFLHRYWKIIGGYLVMVIMELFTSLTAGGDRPLSIARVLKLEHFRESLRHVYQGKGLPPDALSPEQRADDEARAAAEYANSRKAKAE